jgi:hypothetical protein
MQCSATELLAVQPRSDIITSHRQLRKCFLEGLCVVSKQHDVCHSADSTNVLQLAVQLSQRAQAV